jgi:glycosyltransferase involved in cell wall biosynthesis
MKKVLLTVNNNRLSGIEKYTLLLAQYLDKDKYKVEIGIPTFGSFCNILEEKNIDYFIFDNKVNGRYTLSGIRFLFKKIFKEKYDIIHAQAGIAPCVIGKLIGTKLLVEHKHGLDFTTEQINKLNTFRRYYEKSKKYFVNQTITVCEADKMTLIEKFGYKDRKVKAIYNGIENLPYSTLPKDNKKIIIGTIGRLTYQKGQEYFIEMAKILKDKGFDFEYHIYGDGEKMNEYKLQIEYLNLHDSVFLKGYSKNVPGVLNTFHIFVLPSRYEGIPYVILEAMKESVPIICTDVGGISEVIVSNHNGILVKKEDASELAEKVLELNDSKELIKRITDNAKKDFEEKYTIDKTLNAIENIYSENKQF